MAFLVRPPPLVPLSSPGVDLRTTSSGAGGRLPIALGVGLGLPAVGVVDEEGERGILGRSSQEGLEDVAGFRHFSSISDVERGRSRDGALEEEGWKLMGLGFVRGLILWGKVIQMGLNSASLL